MISSKRIDRAERKASAGIVDRENAGYGRVFNVLCGAATKFETYWHISDNEYNLDDNIVDDRFVFKSSCSGNDEWRKDSSVCCLRNEPSGAVWISGSAFFDN